MGRSCCRAAASCRSSSSSSRRNPKWASMATLSSFNDGVGMASAKYHLADVGGWLTSTQKGEIVHVNGLSGKVDGKVTLAGSTGHPMKIVQQGGVVLIVDEVTGVVSRVDPAHLNVVQGAGYRGAAGMQVVSGSGSAYALDQKQGSVQRLDPMTLATKGTPLSLTGPLGAGAIDATSVLWVPVPAVGQAANVHAGQPARPVGVGRAGDDLALTIAAGVPVITDFTAAEAIVLGPNGTQLKVRLPSTVAQAPKGSVLAPASTDGQLVPLLAGRSLVVLNSGNGTLSTTALQLPPGHTLAAPQALGQKVYIPDQSSGSLLVYDSATNRMGQQVPVTGRSGPLDAFVKDGLLWVNGPDSAKAVVVDGAGTHRPIQKYSPDVPGGANNPLPKVGLPGGNRGAPRPGGGGGHPSLPKTPPTHKPDPPKVVPPNAPTNLRATAQPDGTIKVDFQPGGGGKTTGFKLLMPAGLTAKPAQIGANGPDYTFTVSGGQCGSEYERFARGPASSSAHSGLIEATSRAHSRLVSTSSAAMTNAGGFFDSALPGLIANRNPRAPTYSLVACLRARRIAVARASPRRWLKDDARISPASCAPIWDSSPARIARWIASSSSDSPRRGIAIPRPFAARRICSTTSCHSRMRR